MEQAFDKWTCRNAYSQTILHAYHQRQQRKWEESSAEKEETKSGDMISQSKKVLR